MHNYELRESSGGEENCIVIEKLLSVFLSLEWGYGVDIVLPTVIYFMFYLVALGWIYYADWFR